jgi:excinuclease ABC subunit C
MLKINLKNIPESSGVYIFKDKKNKALYIGKTKNLRKRIQQYFQSDSLKIKKLLETAEDLEVIETENEINAIFKESDLIKKLDPPFNQLLRDDSRYFYLIFTQEILPKIFITHQPEKFKAQKVIGPFFIGSSLKKILSLIRKDIPFCTCKEKHLRNCLNAELSLCFGWCCLKNNDLTKKQTRSYQQNLKLIEKIFTQDLKSSKKNLLKSIKKLLAQNEIDKAQKLKQVFLAIEKLELNQELIKEDSLFLEHQTKKILFQLKEILNLKTFPHLIETADISHFAGKEKVGVLVSFLDGIYQPQFLRKFKIKTVLKPDDPRMIYEMLTRRLNHQEWGLPDLFLIDGGKVQLKFAQKAIEGSNLNIDVIALAKPNQELYFANQKINLKDYPLIKNFIFALDQKAHQIVLKYHQKKRESLII